MRNSIFALAVCSLLSTNLAAQTGPSILPQRVTSRPPVHVAPPATPGDIDHQPIHASGEPDALVAVDVGDDLPLPTAAQYRIATEGDVETAPASGDPFFLGFAAENYYPPQGEKIDPRLLAQLRSHYADGRPAQETYAYVMFDKRITAARRATLESLGVRVLQFHPFYTVKVALPPQQIELVAALDFVHWIGVARPRQRVHPLLARILSEPADRSDGFVDVYVDVFESDQNAASEQVVLARPWIGGRGEPPHEQQDGNAATKWMSHGWQERALAAAGLQVTGYVDEIRAFRARMHPASLEALLALDFVQFVEFDGPIAPLSPTPSRAGPDPHDESMPLIDADVSRAQFNGSASSSVVAGIIDSGIDILHSDLNPNYVAWDLTPVNLPTNDLCEHGSHVSGTILGDGTTRASLRGVAPGLGWGNAGRFYSVKIFWGTACLNPPIALATMVNLMHTPYFDGVTTTPIPQVINCSWGSSYSGSIGYYGTEADARTIDDECFNYYQLYVFSMGNGGPVQGHMSLQAASKNAFSVGSVVDHPSAAYGDPGHIYDNVNYGSSVGPTGDGRWKPNVCAPGDTITSVDANSTNGYKTLSGTSMATPHVTGLAAQLLDHNPWMQSWPEATKALLMASAMTKDDVLIGVPTDPNLVIYGAGRIEGYRAHWSSSQIQTYVWAFGLGNSSTYVDFPVNAGATRIIACMHYSEPSASAGASQALVNNFNMYVDRPPIDTLNNNTGEYTAQQSLKDNTEIRMIDASIYGPGTWRLKVYPESVTGSGYFGVVVQIIYGNTKPDGTLTVTASDLFVQPNQDVTINATVTNPSFIASAVVLDSTSTGDTLQSVSTTLEDGPVTDLLHNESAGRDVTLGDIRHGTQRSASWVTRWPTEGVQNWSVNARSDNWVDKTQAINVTVDGTPPGDPWNLVSTTHSINTWSNNPNVGFAWNAAPDNLSGIDGYGIDWGSTPSPGPTKDIEEVTSYVLALPNGANLNFALRAVDNSGNWAPGFVTSGPYKIDTISPSGPSGLNSPSHTVGVQSCSTIVTVNWTAGFDALSGLGGYIGVWDTSATTAPTGSTNLAAAATGYTAVIGSSTSARYFHLRAKDNAGNYGTTQHFGPVYANAISVQSYCTGKTNSLGCVPTIASTNQPDLSAGTFTVTCSNALNQKNGLLFWGHASIAVPFQGGTLCVGAPTVRCLNINSGGAATGNSCTGTYSHAWTTSYMNANGVVPGNTIYAQWWMRDPASASTTGLSNAIRFTVCQ